MKKHLLVILFIACSTIIEAKCPIPFHSIKLRNGALAAFFLSVMAKNSNAVKNLLEDAVWKNIRIASSAILASCYSYDLFHKENEARHIENIELNTN